MKTAISFTVPMAGQSVQKGGKRMMIRNGKPLFFKDRRTQSYDDALTLLAAEHRPASPIESGVSLTLTFVMRRPGALMRQRDAAGLIPAGRRPDLDNLIKGVLDPLTRLGFWRDDAQITELTARKYYAEKTGCPRIEVVIAAAEQAAVETGGTPL